MKSRVFVVQCQHRWNRERQALEPKYDVTAAAEYGEIRYLLSPTAAPFRPEPIVEELHAKLADFRPSDYLLLIGNPVLIGLAVAIAARVTNGIVSMLQWSGKDQRYIPVRVHVYPRGGEHEQK